ncbi:MAG: helix-turn-helix domain-containing protein [Desulfobaccales bacterium]
MERGQDHYVNDIEAAKLLGVSPQTLRNWRFLGKGPAYTKRGRMIRYRVQDLLDFMSAGRVDPEGRRGAAK